MGDLIFKCIYLVIYGVNDFFTLNLDKHYIWMYLWTVFNAHPLCVCICARACLLAFLVQWLKPEVKTFRPVLKPIYTSVLVTLPYEVVPWPFVPGVTSSEAKQSWIHGHTHTHTHRCNGLFYLSVKILVSTSIFYIYF